MPRLSRITMAALPVVVFSLSMPLPANATKVLAQAPCTYTNGVCLAFQADVTPIPVVRSYTFNMPTKGAALVNFQGTLHCGNGANTLKVIDIVSQIVTSPTAVPDYTKPGGSRNAIVLIAFADNITPSLTLNVSASRRFSYNSGGSKTVHFVMARSRMDSATDCRVFTAAFNVVITP